MRKIEMPIAEFEGFKIVEVLESHIEINSNSLLSIQKYQSVETDDEGTGIPVEYYRDRFIRYKLSEIIGVEKSYIQTNDCWRIQISVRGGNDLIYLVPTESAAQYILDHLNDILFR